MFEILLFVFKHTYNTFQWKQYIGIFSQVTRYMEQVCTLRSSFGLLGKFELGQCGFLALLCSHSAYFFNIQILEHWVRYLLYLVYFYLFAYLCLYLFLVIPISDKSVSGLILGCPLGTIWGVTDWNQVCWLQGKCSTCWTISSTPFLILWHIIWYNEPSLLYFYLFCSRFMMHFFSLLQ